MKTFNRSARYVGAILLFGAMLNAYGAATTIANEPMVTSGTSTVQPNVFLMMDDSGSMDYDYMPDDAKNFGSNKYGAAAPQCNGVFYDPAIKYVAPVDSTGASYTDSTFANAWDNGYVPTGGKTNLSINFVDAGGDTARPAFYFTYSGTQTTEKLKDYYNTGSTFYKECNSAVSSATITVGGNTSTTVTGVTLNGTTITMSSTTTNSSTMAGNIVSAINASTTGYRATSFTNTVTIYGIKPSDAGTTPGVSVSAGTMTFSNTAFTTTTGSSVFTKVLVSATSGPGATDERTNFANWWSFYHTRMLMMKTSTGLAFKSICATTDPTCNYRVGFATINNTTGSDLLALGTFDAAQKANWYTKLYAAKAGSTTPTREALADVGRMYANKLPATNSNKNALNSSVPDPIQYACQQNFTILTTDGFWNSTTNPVKLDGTSIGNQDYFETRSPQARYDGANYSSTSETDYTTVQRIKTDISGVVTTKTWSRTDVTIGAACTVTAAKLPKSTTTSYMADGTGTKAILASLSLSATNPQGTGGLCFQLSPAGTTKAWLCRGTIASSPGNPPDNNASVTDSTGITWYLVSSMTGNSGCTTDRTAFASNNYSTSKGACPNTPAVSGSYVVTTPWTNKETLTGMTSTSTDDVSSMQYTTQTTINGVVGPVSALSTPPTVTSANVSSGSTPATSDVYAGWVAGTVTSNICTKPPLPAPSSSTPTATTSSTAGTTVKTVLSTNTTTGTPFVTTSSNSGGSSNTMADVAEYYYITDLRTSALGNQYSGASGTGINGSDISANVVPPSGVDVATHQHMTTFTLGLGARGRLVFDPGYESAKSGDYYSIVKGYKAGYAPDGITPDASVCPWITTGSTCNWPIPPNNSIEGVDDLWHAAVNGRGTYFSASNPTTLAVGLSNALAGVTARTGSSAAAATSTPFPTSIDNFIFSSTYTTQDWTGELTQTRLDLASATATTAPDWQVQDKLDKNSARNIYFFDSGSANNLSTFTWANLYAAGRKDIFFDEAHIASLTQLSCSVIGNCLSNWTSGTAYAAGNVYRHTVGMVTTWYHVDTGYTSGTTFGATDTSNTSTSSTMGPDGINLVAYIKGDNTYEGDDVNNINGKFFRQRTHLLGDLVNSEPAYVQGALSPDYADPGYPAFKTARTKTMNGAGTVQVSGRQAMVYIGANDGMLHAFYAASDMMNMTTGDAVTTGGTNVVAGNEAWAFIPTAVIPNLYRLADKEYKKTNYHRYFVDGSPVVADVCVSNCTVAGSAVWKTILVGGLNAGGNSYYALDITNPAKPVALWEFTDTNMGLTYGNPKVVKLKTGQWVVLFTSGFNNTAGDGKGYLYVVDAYTGAMATSVNGTGIIGTGVGSVATPSNLGRLDAWLTTPGIDSTAEAVYAGDMSGNLWRFDINGDVGAAGYDAQLLVTLTGPTGSTNTNPGNVQPITAKPLLTLRGTTHMVMVGTGLYLGSADQSDTSQQSFYAIADTASTTTTPGTAVYANPRTSGFVQQTQTLTTCPSGSPGNVCAAGQSVVISSNKPVVLSGTVHGWYVDFPLSLTTGKSTGERVTVDPDIMNGALVINTNEPSSSSCSLGGISYEYQMNYSTGGPLGVSTTGVVGTQLSNSLSSAPDILTLPPDASGKSKKVICTQLSDGTLKCVEAFDMSGGGGTPPTYGTPIRKSWRELIMH